MQALIVVAALAPVPFDGLVNGQWNKQKSGVALDTKSLSSRI
jgi:hypothetical protein